MIKPMASWLVWLVAVAAGVTTVPMLWVADHIASEDGWVEFTAGFVEDDELRDAVVSTVSGAALAAVTLPAPLAATVDDAFQQIVRTAVDLPGFTEAWRESLRRTHQLTFDPQKRSERLVVDIGPLATFVVQDVSKNLPIRLSVPDTLPVPVYEAPDPELIDTVNSSTSRSRLGLAITGVALLVSMALAGGIGPAVRRLGLAALAVAGVMAAVTGVALPELLDRTPASSDFARQMRDLLVAHASSSLDGWALHLAIVGAVVAGAGIVAGVVSRRT